MKISRSARKTLRTGVRWKKGQSSSSNPRCHRFRDAAAAAAGKRTAMVRFSDVAVGGGGGVGGSSGVTESALARHNRRLEDADADDSSVAADSEAETAETWATNFTGCTNRCFDRVLAHWADRQNSEARRAAVAVLAGVAQLIRDAGGRETNEEYFQALLTALVSVEDANRPAAAHLLSVLLRRMEPSAVAPAFAALSRACLQLLLVAAAMPQQQLLNPALSVAGDAAGSSATDEPAAAAAAAATVGLKRSLLLCLGCGLAALPKTQWHAAANRQVLQAVLQFTQSDRPKLRKAARRAVADCLAATKAAVPAALVTSFALDRVSSAASPSATLQSLRLLRDCAPHQSERQAKSTVESCLTLAAASADSAVYGESMRVIRAVFWRRPQPQLCGQILTALYDARPPLEDAASAKCWLETARAGVGALAIDEEGDAESAEDGGNASEILEAHWARLFNEAFRGLSNSGATEAARRLCRDACHHLMTETVTSARFQRRPEALGKARATMLASLESGLSYQFYSAWPHVSRLLAAFMRCHGPDCWAEQPHLLTRCLALLADLRDSLGEGGRDGSGGGDAALVGCLEFALAAGLESLGPAAFLTAVPPVGLADETSLKRSWLLPMLCRRVRAGAELAAFVRHLLPIAERGGASKTPTGRLLELQVWSTLPGFCAGPVDFPEAAPALAKRLGDMLVGGRADLRLHLLAALRRLLAFASDNGDSNNAVDATTAVRRSRVRALMSGYAKNYVPRLFALHSDTGALRSHRLAALETIRSYAPLCPTDLLSGWFAKAAEKARTAAAAAAAADNDDNARGSSGRESADLAIALAPSLADPTVAVQLCADWWQHGGSQQLEKKGYRMAETLLTAARRRGVAAGGSCPPESDPRQQAIRRLAGFLLEAAAAGPASPSSRKSRLRCLALCVASDWLTTSSSGGGGGVAARMRLAEIALPEAVLGCREINSQAREAADSLLLEVFKFYSAHHIGSSEGDSEEGHQGSESVALSFLSAVFSAAGTDPDTLQAALYSVTGLLGHLRHCMGRDLVASLVRRLSDTMSASESPRTLVKAALRCLASVVRKFGHVTTLDQVSACLECLPVGLRPVFRATVRRILTDLLSAYPMDALRSGLPQFYHRQLTNIRKRTTGSRKRLSAAAKSRDGKSADEQWDGDAASSVATRVVRGIDDLLRMSDDEGDGDNDGEGEGDGKATSAWLEEGDGEILDLRDPGAAARIHRSRPAGLAERGKNKRKANGEGEGGGFKIAADGRLIIGDEGEGSEGEGEKANVKRRRKLSLASAEDDAASADALDDDEAEESDEVDEAARNASSASGGRYQPGGRGIHRDTRAAADAGKKLPQRKQQKQQKKQKKQSASTGVDPYSFLALDRRLLNRKNQAGKRARLVKYKSLVRTGSKSAKRRR